jgi:hypothetical protein
LVPLNQKEAEWRWQKFTLLTDKIAQSQAPALQGIMGFGDPQSFTSKDRRY